MLLYIYGRVDGNGFLIFFFGVIFLIGIASLVGIYWYAFGVLGVMGILLYLASFVYLLYNKFGNRSILFGLFLAIPMLFIAYWFADPFLYCQGPEVYYDYEERDYVKPLLTETFQKLGLLKDCVSPLR